MLSVWGKQACKQIRPIANACDEDTVGISSGEFGQRSQGRRVQKVTCVGAARQRAWEGSTGRGCQAEASINEGVQA